MGKHIGRGNGDHELIQAAQEALRAIRDHKMVVEVAVNDTGRRGVLEVDCRAFEVLADGTTAQVARHRAEWPNAHPSTFAAHLFQCATKLAMMVEEWLAAPF